MANKITGDELAMPKIETERRTDSYNGQTLMYGNVHSSGGLTIRQLALKDFMCAIVKREGITLPDDIEWVTRNAAELTEAYINQLNKKQ